jgi:uncharacterized secreted protein with C-terminal beta-propeller domain
MRKNRLFGVYILLQKEKLSGQVKRAMQAYLPKKVVRRKKEKWNYSG